MAQSTNKDWYKISAFCSAFLDACKARKLDKEATHAEIIKSAQADEQVAKEWDRFFKALNN